MGQLPSLPAARRVDGRVEHGHRGGRAQLEERVQQLAGPIPALGALRNQQEHVVGVEVRSDLILVLQRCLVDMYRYIQVCI